MLAEKYLVDVFKEEKNVNDTWAVQKETIINITIDHFPSRQLLMSSNN